jgi:hypothetical protein
LTIINSCICRRDQFRLRVIVTDVVILHRGSVPSLHRQSFASALSLSTIKPVSVFTFAQSSPMHLPVNYTCALSSVLRVVSTVSSNTSSPQQLPTASTCYLRRRLRHHQLFGHRHGQGHRSYVNSEHRRAITRPQWLSASSGIIETRNVTFFHIDIETGRAAIHSERHKSFEIVGRAVECFG